MRQAIKGKHLNKGVTTVDMRTGKETKSKTTMMMLPAKEGTCAECAVAHDPKQPHNAQSLFCQYHFYNEHGRWPTWVDAMAHCAKDLADEWKGHLVKMGVNVDAGEVNPGKGAKK